MLLPHPDLFLKTLNFSTSSNVTLKSSFFCCCKDILDIIKFSGDDNDLRSRRLLSLTLCWLEDKDDIDVETPWMTKEPPAETDLVWIRWGDQRDQHKMNSATRTGGLGVVEWE